jgi:predicted nucleic acid-binding protein
MTAGVVDTSVFIARESGRALDTNAFPEDVGVSIITMGELRAGVLAAADLDTLDRRLATFSAARALEPIPIDEPVADAWARLRITLRDRGHSMPINDSWIAATAIALGVGVITRDDDYDRVPDLTVIKV